MIRVLPVAATVLLCMGLLAPELRAADSGWIERAPLPSVRLAHQALLLQNGTVLVVGGFGGEHGQTSELSSDIYDFRKNTWGRHAATGFKHVTTDTFALVPLPLSRALALSPNNDGASASEEYDPLQAKWRAIPKLPDARLGFQAVALANGDVLVAGGYLVGGGGMTSLNSCLLYHPGSRTWTTTGGMIIARQEFTLSLLNTGRVLAAGGLSLVDGSGFQFAACDAYVPELGVWQAAGAMTTFRTSHDACVLANGDVVITGSASTSSEEYVPSTKHATATNACTVPYGASFTVLRGGALRAGGVPLMGSDTALAAVDVFSAKTHTWSAGPALHNARHLAAAVSLPSGEALVIGGTGTADQAGNTPLVSTELYALRPFFQPAAAEAVATQGVTFTYQLDAAAVATYTSVGLPPGIALNKATGHLGGKPTTPGSYRVRIGATNEFGKSLMYLTISVAPAQTTAAPQAPQAGG